MANTGAKFIITEIKGEAYVRKENGEIIRLNEGDILEEGDVLLTGDGEVTLTDESGAELTIPANYTLTLAATLPPELPDAGENGQGEDALPDTTETPSGPDGGGASDGGGSSFFNAPRTDYLQDNRFIDQGNLNRDINDVFSFMGRHTENPRIQYQFDLDRVKFPLYGPELDQWGGGRRDDYTPPVGQHEQDNSDLDSRFLLAPDQNSVKEDGPLTASGSVLDNDRGRELKVVGVMKQGDPGAPSSGNVGNEVQGEYGTVKINADGTYTYVLDNDDARVQALAAGEKFTETFVYSATDRRGETATTTLTITINGMNDDPKISVLGGDSDSASLAETNAGLTADGTLSIADVDTSDKVTVSVKDVQISGHDLPSVLTPQQIKQMLTFGSTTVLQSGETEKEGGIEWKFDSGSEAFNFLPAGEKLTLTYTVEVDDGHGGKDTHPVTITITGTNDAPTANNDTNEIHEDAKSVHGNVIKGGSEGDVPDTDPDGDELTVVGVVTGESDVPVTDGEGVSGGGVTGQYGNIVINPDGSYTYTPDHDKTNPLKEGEEVEDVFTYTISDGNGGIDTATITIRITGENDPPVANPDIRGIDEDSGPITGNVIESDQDGDVKDIDPDGDKLTVVGVGIGDVDEDETSADNVGQELEGVWGTIKINPDGSYTYTPDHNKTNPLKEGQNEEDVFTYTISDGNGGFSTTTVTITITGTNDAPTAVDDSNSVRRAKEGSSSPVITGNVLENDSDPEDETLEVTKIRGKEEDIEIGTEGETEITGTYGTLYIKPDGSYRYQPNDKNEDVSGLKWGEKLEDKFEYEITDGHTIPEGYEDHKATLTIEIRGLLIKDTDKIYEDGPSISGNVLTNDKEGSEDPLTVIGVRPGSDPENEENQASGNVGEPIKGAYGWVTIKDDGSYTYKLDNGDPRIQALAEGEQHLTDSFVYKASDGDEDDSTTLTITIIGTNDAPEIGCKEDDYGNKDKETIQDYSTDPVSGTLYVGDVDNNDVVKVEISAVQNSDYDLKFSEEELKNLLEFESETVLGASDTFKENGIKWTFTPQNLNFIPDGQTATLVYTVTVTDKEGATASHNVTINITGNDDTGSLPHPLTETISEDQHNNEPLHGQLLHKDNKGYEDDPDEGQTVRIKSYTIEGMGSEEGGNGGFTVGTEHDVYTAHGKIGKITIKADGTYDFYTEKDYSGELEIAYQGESGSDEKGWKDIGDSTLKITVNPVADAPTINEPSPSTDEDEPVSLGLEIPKITDLTDRTGMEDDHDNPERLGLITLEFKNFLDGQDDLQGAKLFFGEEDYTNKLQYDGDKDIKWVKIKLTETGNDEYHINGINLSEPGVIVLTKEQYEGLKIQQADHHHENIEVTVRATSYEVNNEGVPLGNDDSVYAATTTVEFTVDVKAVTDPIKSFTIDGKDEYTYETNEDTEFSLSNLLSTDFDDLDASENRWIEISGDAAKLQNIAIKVNGNTISLEDGVYKIPCPGLSTPAKNFPDITIGGIKDFSGIIEGLTVTLKAQDRDDDSPQHTPDVLEKSVTLNMDILPVADDIVFNNAVTNEDTAVKFLDGLALTDTDGSEEFTKILLLKDNIPAGWTIKDHAGQIVVDKDGNLGSGVTTEEIDLETYIVINHGKTGNTYNYKNYTALPPSHSSLDWKDVTIKANTKDTAGEHTVPGEFTETADIVVKPVAERITENSSDPFYDTDGDGSADLTMTPGKDYTTPATEDIPFALNQDGFVFSAGWGNQDAKGTPYGSEDTFALLTPQVWDHSANGGAGEFVTATGAKFTWTEKGSPKSATFDGTNGIAIPVEALDSVKFTAPPNMAGEFRITVQAKTVDYDEDHPDDIGKADTAISGEAILQNLIVNPVADKVTVAISQAVGKEDEPIKLDIRPSSEDPNETFNVTILKTSIPGGAKFTYDGEEIDPAAVVGTKFADGRVEITDDGVKFIDYQPGLLTVTPPHNSDVDFNLKIQTVAVDTVYTQSGEITVETQESEIKILDLKVTVDSVADGATLNLIEEQSVTELEAENGGITLNTIVSSYTMLDNDGTEKLSLIITGLKDEFSLSGSDATFLGGTGTGRQWSVDPAKLANVYVNTEENFNGVIDLKVRAVTTELKNGHAHEGSLQDVKVIVTPTPEAGMNLEAFGSEDAKVKLDFSVEHKGGDTDEEITKVWIRADGGNGVDGKDITLFSKEGENPYTELESKVIGEEEWYEISYNDLGKIFAQGPANFSGKLEFKVKYEVTDPGNGVPDKTTSSDEVDYTLTFAPVTDKTATTLPDEESKFTTDEKSDVAIVDGYVTITATGETTFSFVVTVNQQPDSAAGGNADVDGSEKLEYFIIDNVPAGLSIEGGHYMGNSSTGVFTGRWIVKMEGEEAEFNADPDTNPDGAVTRNFEFTLDNSAGLFNFHDESYPITITAYSRDGEAINQETSDAKWTLKIDLQGEGGGYDLIPATVNAEIKLDPVTNKMQPGEEDKPLDLKDLVTFTITDNNDPEQDGYDLPRFSITLTGLPEGTVVHGMIKDGDVWTASSQGGQDKLDQLVGTISIELPKDWNSNNHSGDDAFKFDATITSYTPGGQTADKTAPGVEPYIEPVTDPAQISIDVTSVDEHQSEGGDDVEITIDLSNAADGSNAGIVGGKLYLKLDGLNNGGTLAINDSSPGYLEDNLKDGYYVISGVGPTDKIELTYTPENYVSGDFSVEAYVFSQETGATNQVKSDNSATFTINPVNSGYDFTGGTTGTASGDEDTKILINAAGKLADWEDGSEEIVSATLTNVPEGFIVYTGGDENGVGAVIASNAGGGTWSIPLSGSALPERIWVKAPEKWSGVEEGIELNVWASDSGLSPEISTKVFTVQVNPDADGIKIDPTQTFGKAGEEIAINLNASMEDTDGSETVTLTFKGVGEYAQFLAGGTTLVPDSYNAGTDTYTLSGITHEQVRDLYLVQGAMNTKQITVEAWTVDEALNAEGATVTDKSGHVTKTFDLTISPVGGTIGNDIMLYYTGQTLDGKAGTDTLEFRYGETVDFSAAGVVGNIKNFEIFDLTGNGAQSLENLSAEHVLAMSGDNGNLTIKGDGEDTVQLDDVWDKGGTADAFTTYTSGDATLKISEGVNVIDSSGNTIQSFGVGMGKMMAMGAFSFDPEEGGSAGQGGSSAGYEPFPQSGESDPDGQEWNSSSPSSQEGEGSSHGSDWDAAGGSDSGDGDSEQGGGFHEGSGASDTGSDMIPIGSGPETSSGGDSDPEGQGGLDEALEGLSAADVFDMGNDDLPLPGGDDGLGNVPDTGGADVPEFYAPDVPDSAAQIAEDMEEALSA